MKRAMITGVTGQDGTYLAELLLAKGYEVIGAVRDIEGAKNKLPPSMVNKIKLVAFDMLSKPSMIDILSKYRPTEIYNLAAFASGSGMFDDPVGIGEINGLAVARILDAIRETGLSIRFCQASSREIFGEAVDSPQSELTIPCPRNPYGAAKLYADSMVRIYRQHYGQFACSAILFNHESPRRGMGFVTRKITSGAAKIKLGLAQELCLGNLDTLRDWGYAGDYVYGMWLMLQQDSPDDYVLATGVTHSVRDFCEHAFGVIGLDYQAYVKTDSVNYRASESSLLIGDANKARTKLKWEPTINFREMVLMMVESDMCLYGTIKNNNS